MDETTLITSIIGIIIGAIPSYLVSKHFFKKGEKEKSLTPYIQFSSKLFSELDHELKEDLVVNYKKQNVENLAQAQFVIANTGDIPIKDIIEPLRLILPPENKLFDISILHIQPEGRDIKYKIIETGISNAIEFNIPLLNAGEYFVFKILTQDTLPKESIDEEIDKVDDKDDFEEDETPYLFTITADELPPRLKISELPYSYYEYDTIMGYDWTAFWVGLSSLIIFTSIFGTLYSLKLQSQNLYLFNPSSFFRWDTFTYYNIFVIVLGLIGIMALLATIVFIIMALTDIPRKPKPKFRIPNKFRKDRKFLPFDILN